ncbi:hypothetical protein FHS30_000254 [Simiduia aestuariiviva]|uniref:Uncharacterized protein n=1 Tax=Simiduia aestuariiviva TaxID=1510459 RepID=A0A839UND0_9GAMM|nr:hypothetical protein [Simiduia aestuariiviva]
MMFAVSILIYRLAIADKKKGWIWFGVNLCVSMVLGKFYGLSVLVAMGAGFATFIIMFLVNIVSPRKIN